MKANGFRMLVTRKADSGWASASGTADSAAAAATAWMLPTHRKPVSRVAEVRLAAVHQAVPGPRPWSRLAKAV